MVCNQYKGKCGAVRVNQEELFKQVEKAFKAIEIKDEELAKDIASQIKNRYRYEKENNEIKIAKIRKDIDNSKKRIQIMYEDRVDERITPIEYDQKAKKEKQTIIDLEDKLAHIDQIEEEFMKTSLYILELSKRAYKIFLSSKPERKRRLMNFVLSNLRL